MSKRNNTVDSFDGDLEVRRGGGRWLVVLLVVVGGGYFGGKVLSGYLLPYLPSGAGDLSLGAWVVATVLALFLVWCFSGSKGGSR